MMADSRLPLELQITDANPVFGNNAADVYAKKYFDRAIAPQLDSAATDRWLSGNLGQGTGSSFGSTYLSNLENQGRKESFFAGEDYRNQQINQTLGRRDSFFGNNARIAQEQNNLDIQRSLGLEGITTNRLGMMNNFNLGGAQLLSGIQENDMQRKWEAAQAKSQAFGNLIGGAFGLGGGLINGMRKGGATSLPSANVGVSGGGGQMFSSGAFGNSYLGY